MPDHACQASTMFKNNIAVNHKRDFLVCGMRQHKLRQGIICEHWSCHEDLASSLLIIRLHAKFRSG